MDWKKHRVDNMVKNLKSKIEIAMRDAAGDEIQKGIRQYIGERTTGEEMENYCFEIFMEYAYIVDHAPESIFEGLRERLMEEDSDD